MSKNTSYFSHDSNARNDEKILAMRMRHGAEGYGIYFMLIERLRDEADYTSVKDYNMIAFDLRVSAEKVKSVVEEFGLFSFTESGKRFYSESFMARMQLKDEKTKRRSEAGKKGMEKRWKGEKDNNVTSSNNNVITNGKNQITSKVKESKDVLLSKIQKEFYDSLIPHVDEFGKDIIREFYNYWSEPNKSQTKIRYQLEKTWDLKRRLQRWANHNFKGSKTEQPTKIKEPQRPKEW